MRFYLAFKRTRVKSPGDKVKIKTTNGTSGNRVVGSGEDGIDRVVGVRLEHGLDLVEVERDVARNRAVETGFEEGCPVVAEIVVFANSGDS